MGEIFAAGALVLVLVLPLLLNRYFGRLPEAPSCPACRTVTHAVLSPRLAGHRLPLLTLTAVRQCGQCGWRGRMRWRLAAGGVRRGA